MAKPYEFIIAFRYLRAKRKQVFISVITFISILGFMLGVATLIVVLAVMKGLEADLLDKILCANSHLSITRYDVPIDNYPDLVKKVERVEGVIAASPYIEKQAMLVGDNRASGVLIRGIQPSSASQVTCIEEAFFTGGGGLKSLEDRTGDDIEGEPKAAIGSDLSARLGLTLRDQFYLISPWGRLSPFGVTPKMKPFEVSGIFEFGFWEIDSTVVFMSLREAQKFFSLSDSVTGIEVRVIDTSQLYKVKERISHVVGREYRLRDWAEANKPLFNALALERLAFGIIFGLTVLVAGLNVVTTLIMVVMEKYHDIAILKTMGSTNRSIMKVFIVNGVVVGVIGTVLGAILGLTICYVQAKYRIIELDPSVYFISYLPVKPSLTYVVVISSVSILTSFIATLYPAWQAAKMSPAETLRYE